MNSLNSTLPRGKGSISPNLFKIFSFLFIIVFISLSAFLAFELFFKVRGELYEPGKLALVTTNVTYGDLLATENSEMVGVSYNPSSKDFSLYPLEEGANLAAFVSESSPYVEAPQKRGVESLFKSGESEWVYSNSLSGQVKRFEDLGSVALDEGGFYFSKIQNKTSQLYFYNAKSDKINSIEPPFSKGHFYNPYLFQKKEIVVYSAISFDPKEEGPFKFTTFFILKRGDENAIQIPVAKSELPFLAPRKISENSDASVFAFQTDTIGKNRLFFCHMKYFPFSGELLKRRGASGYELGYALEIEGVKEIHSFRFDPIVKNKLHLIARSNIVYNLYTLELREKTIRGQFNGLYFGLFLFLILLSGLIVILYKRTRV